ncbi:MAG: flagellar hook-basal body complex protein FliE [Alphaproteobacteria bacterium]|nr:flagellar hook-basal body complex protein FliE [Alphaproteobacteria bacterium]
MYQAAAKRGVSNVTGNEDSASSGASALGAAGDTFGNVLGNVVDSTVTSSKAAEEFSSKAIAGEADINDVVMAVANAELALETVVAIRDKATAAYQEIMKMPI